jgi:hypothetical protein
MAERVILICDVCGEAASDTVTIKLRRRTLQKDLCTPHLQDLVAGTASSRAGRTPSGRAGSRG